MTNLKAPVPPYLWDRRQHDADVKEKNNMINMLSVFSLLSRMQMNSGGCQRTSPLSTTKDFNEKDAISKKEKKKRDGLSDCPTVTPGNRRLVNVRTSEWSSKDSRGLRGQPLNRSDPADPVGCGLVAVY